MNSMSSKQSSFSSRHNGTGLRKIVRQPVNWAIFALLSAIAILIMGTPDEPAGAFPRTTVALDITRPVEPASTGLPGEITTSGTSLQPQPLSENLPEPAAWQPPAGTWHEVTVKRGDSLAYIFAKLDIPPQQLHAITSRGGAARNLKSIYPGQTLRIMTSEQDDLLQLHYQIDRLSKLKITRNGDNFDVSTEHKTPERRTAHASGTITSSLFLAAQKAGLSDALTMNLANIFGWDIDFALDIREGDQFTVLYEEVFLEGEKIDNGNILAAEFINRGRTYQAFRYTDAGGKTDFYSLDGKSMRKAFLRTPVEFSRISSRFSLGRRHPILNKMRAHKGVDYAASRGTPIKSTGNGKIVHRGKKGGYGNAVIIQHGTKYSTLYAHMSRFKRGQKVGSRIKQGDVIGYIGSSGLATGPHLHYEFRINGVHRNPLKVKLPGAEPLRKKYHGDFKNKANTLVTQLDTVRSTRLASNK